MHGYNYNRRNALPVLSLPAESKDHRGKKAKTAAQKLRADERSLGCVHHDAEVKASIVKFYIVTRLHFLVKGINKAKEERRKMLQHLK
ncbi:hypothetical protein V5799_029162, partial [Amblyomma americanum]